MNVDLEKQLAEMGPDYRAVVDRLRAAMTVEPGARGQGPRSRSTVEWLVAATLLLAFGLSAVFLTPPPNSLIPNPQSLIPNPQSLIPNPSYGAREYRQSVSEILATQRPDGSWQNDFLTRRNAEILARCDGAAAHIAYKKAMRNLRARGIL